MKSDVQIAAEAKLKPILAIAAKFGIPAKYIECYGDHKAKVRIDILKTLKPRKKAKYIVVTGITPTHLGEGKTVTTIGLAMALAALKKEYSAKFDEKENILNELKVRGDEDEKEKAAELKKIEDDFDAARDGLTAEITAWERKLKDETSRTEKEKKDFDREIEKLRLESALKENASAAELQKNERKWRKLQRDLEEQLADIERRFADEKESIKSRLNIKTEEISTIKVRMTLRDERRQSEIKHRQEEVRKIILALEAEQKELEERYAKNTGGLKAGLEASRKELEGLKKDAAAKEEKWRKEGVKGLFVKASPFKCE